MIKEIIKIKSPEDYLSSFWHSLCGEENIPAARVFLCTFIAALLAYHQLIITGHGNPDAICEGLISYTGADWALACGRWATRYMSDVSADVIVPGLWIFLYSACCGTTSILLAKLWRIKSTVSICIMSVLLTVNPTVIEQSLLQYMFMAWGISNLLGVLFVYFNCYSNKHYHRYVLAPICMAIAFGLYQACVSMMCLCFCMTLILRLIDGESFKNMLLDVLKFLISAIIGALLYFAIMNFEIARWGVDESSRVDEFSLSGIILSLPQSFPTSYKTFINYFLDPRFARMKIYALLFVIGVVFVVQALIKLIRQGKVLEVLAVSMLSLLIPAFANSSDIIFPYNVPVLIMQYQSMLVIPFLLAILHRWDSAPNISRLCCNASILLCFALAWGYTVSANATYEVYELTYRNTYHTVSAVLNEIYELPGYSEDETIAFAGYPSDSYLRESISAYDYAYGQYENLVFWPGVSGLQNCRQNYLLNYFGIDGGHVPGMLYNNSVQSQEFKEMPVWPAEGSIQRMNELIIVKFEEDPPIFD